MGAASFSLQLLFFGHYLPITSDGSNLPVTIGFWALWVARPTCWETETAQFRRRSP